MVYRSSDLLVRGTRFVSPCACPWCPNSLCSFWKPHLRLKRRPYSLVDCSLQNNIEECSNKPHRVGTSWAIKQRGGSPATHNYNYQYTNMSVDLFAHHAAAGRSKWSRGGSHWAPWSSWLSVKSWLAQVSGGWQLGSCPASQAAHQNLENNVNEVRPHDELAGFRSA